MVSIGILLASGKKRPCRTENKKNLEGVTKSVAGKGDKSTEHRQSIGHAIQKPRSIKREEMHRNIYASEDVGLTVEKKKRNRKQFGPKFGGL